MAGEAGLEVVIGCRCAGERRPAARVQRHPPRLGRRGGTLDPERYLPLALDLPGHGEAADAERPITFAGCVAHVLAARPERFVLCGYSLGGRVALHVALAAPERVARLVLVSTTAGIEDAAERAERAPPTIGSPTSSNAAPFDDFIERWRTQPLFAGEPPEVGCLAREDQRRNRPTRSPRRCEASAPGRWSRCGTGSRSWRCRSPCWSGYATPSSGRWGSGWWSCCRSRNCPRARRARPAAGEPAAVAA